MNPSQSNPHLRMIQLALETVGSAERLAKALEIRKDELDLYLRDEKPLPNNLFMAALDIVSKGHRTSP